MKMKQILTLGVMVGLVGGLSACGQGTSSSSASSESSRSSESSQTNTPKDSQEGSEVLIGTVKEESTKEAQRLVLESLIPAAQDSKTVPFDEVVLLTEGVTIVDGSDQALTVDQIKTGATIEVTLVENSPVASSLPPQIPGMSIIKIVVPE